ncbi:hypothetical protein D3C85_1110620 [compost metagenome]
MLLGDQRPQLSLRIILKTKLDTGYGDAEFFNEASVDAFLRIDPAGCGAILAGVIETEITYALYSRIDVCVVENDDGGFASQFHMHTLNGVSGAGDDMTAGGH